MYISGYINTNMSEICKYVLEKKYVLKKFLNTFESQRLS